MLDISRYLSIIREYGLSQMQFWIIALLIGIASGLATLGFRLAITYLQFFSYGESGISLTDAVSQLPWFTVMIIPIIGGLIVGIILSSSLGIGVLFASIPVLLYQGSITLMAGLLKPLLVPAVISQMSAVGGLLIVALGLNMIREKKLKVGNMLPAIFIPLIYFLIRN